MSEVKQTTVNPAVPSDRPLGTRNERNLQKSFSASPIYNGELDDDERHLAYQELAMDGNVQDGLGLNSFNRDFTGTERDPVPDLNDVITGGSGLPASPFVPNPTSPGPGSVFPNDQAPFEGELPEAGVEFGSGLGGQTTPVETSQQIASQKIGDYISGRSFRGSDGRS